MKREAKNDVDQRVDVDQAEAEGDRQHQLERLLDGRVAPVEDHPQPLLAAIDPAEPRHRQEDLDEGGDQDRERVDVELGV